MYRLTTLPSERPQFTLPPAQQVPEGESDVMRPERVLYGRDETHGQVGLSGPENQSLPGRYRARPSRNGRVIRS